ncbi:hypothetical protein GOODEAATRI_034353 [Goodea atripinnis]|uniref:Uncharacterized protein n=1 Tax=Goodea atripinnis TaxID=208336 RepID=A0ABV0NHK5_9TELE
MLKDVAGSRSLSTVSPDSVTSVTCAQCEPAFICEDHRAPVANLPILVFSGKCQASCTVLGCEHNPHLWTSGPHTILMESVSNRLCRHMHIPPCTKVDVANLLGNRSVLEVSAHALLCIVCEISGHKRCFRAVPCCCNRVWRSIISTPCQIQFPLY